jgi:hypothetical protein
MSEIETKVNNKFQNCDAILFLHNGSNDVAIFLPPFFADFFHFAHTNIDTHAKL